MYNNNSMDNKNINKIKIQVISDIHLEFYNSYPKIVPMANYLCLAGDIGTIENKFDSKIKKFFTYCSNNWEKTFYVLGNHEFYQKAEFANKKSSFEDLENEYKTICSNFPNIYLLSNSSVEIVPGLNIYGTTLWTNNNKFPEHLCVSDILNDYNMIAIKSSKLLNSNIAINLDFINKKSEIELDKLTNYLNTSTLKNIIMTHFPPIRQGSSNSKYSTQPEYMANYFSWNNIYERLNMLNVIGWISGHTHWSYDINIDETRFVSNQMGYKNECARGETRFDYSKVFEFEY